MALRVGLYLAAVVVTGCDRPAVTTREPVFTQADAEGAPALRPGLWAAPSGDCDYNPNAAAQTWPECAQGYIVRPGEIAPTGGAFEPYLLAGGYPRILQTEVTPPGDEGAVHTYAALVASRFDAQARIVAARRWRIVCPPAKDGEDPAGPCLPPTAAAIRDAARDDSDAEPWIWLRDGER